MDVGASLVIELSPTGLRQSSAIVCTRYTATTKAGFDRGACRRHASRRHSQREASPTPMRAIANFNGP
jgi:hypothetical protein